VASWTSKKPVLLHGFSCYELVLDVARRMRAENKFTMGNTFAPELIWFCPQLDMIGAGEMILGPVGGDGMADWHYIYMRVMGYRKPMSPLVYGLLSHKMTWEAKDRVMQCMLFYAMHPGAAGFLDPAKYEPTRPLFRFYEPIIAWLDLAGWQPITAAKADTASIERYGPGEAELADVAFIALRNLSKKAAAAHVTIEPRAFPKGVQRNSNGWALMSNRPVELSPAPKGQSAMPPIGLEPETTEVIVLGRRESIARLWMESARQWMDRLAREAAWLDARNAANDQKTDPARTTRKQIADVARRAAERLKNLADGDLLATINSQEPAYNQLRDLAASLPDEHQRRCLLLPTQNLADALGRAAEVLTGVTMGFPQNRPFVDAALGETITLKCDLRAGGKSVGDAVATLDGANGLDIRMPEKSPWGWEDVVVVARFQHENQPVWMTRRVTFRFQEKP